MAESLFLDMQEDKENLNETLDCQELFKQIQSLENPVLGAKKSTVTEPRPSPSEFVELSITDIHQILLKKEIKTLKKTVSDVAEFERFLATKQAAKQIHEVSSDFLNEYLAYFILSVRKSDGEEHEPPTLRNIVSSKDHKLKRQKYPHRIIGDQSYVFQLNRDALNAKLKSLKRLA